MKTALWALYIEITTGSYDSKLTPLCSDLLRATTLALHFGCSFKRGSTAVQIQKNEDYFSVTLKVVKRGVKGVKGQRKNYWLSSSNALPCNFFIAKSKSRWPPSISLRKEKTLSEEKLAVVKTPGKPGGYKNSEKTRRL